MNVKDCCRVVTVEHGEGGECVVWCGEGHEMKTLGSSACRVGGVAKANLATCMCLHMVFGFSPKYMFLGIWHPTDGYRHTIFI